ncbi:hypothetical protein EDD90_10659 [Streptomyces sp. Ag109_O5-1]|uniref:hypothetical protein n=1 Tax=Streptomyces sp. Ag109_O5-1 TaxID=1938851 RepID=UPI000F4DBF5B|nr:hypothetical protein [Streptomyces sp. Ag109_O5-1]RPE26689.1 hypothetical protein EDD90_10991 [Streptomyces sp. Ag109_O5-1]RPE47206.1 hypothetical protein EDD90_10659 [Streptomyces sp. Ag109_O5-1]
MSDNVSSPKARNGEPREIRCTRDARELHAQGVYAEVEVTGPARYAVDRLEWNGYNPYVVVAEGYGYDFTGDHPGPPAITAAMRATRCELRVRPLLLEDVSDMASGRNFLDDFNQRHLMVPGGPQWREAASTALAESWSVALDPGMSIEEVYTRIVRNDVRTVHRQLVPLWRHKASSARVLQLEAPLGGSGLTLLDVVAGELRTDDLVFEAGFDDPRIGAVLARLTVEERRVTMAWAHPYTDSWTEAARFAGATDPEALGERVRRKLKRLGIEYARRRAPAGDEER